MQFKDKYYWLLLLIPLCFITLFFFNKNNNVPMRTLPYFGKKNAKTADTVYHTIKPFCFTNQYNQKVTEQTTNNKIYVADFFFTTCKSICPIMSNQLERVYQEFKNDTMFLILSHTVEPEIDSVPILKAYANLHHVCNKNWLFLTGEKKHLYQMARQSYLLNNEQGNGDEDDFIHTQNFALVDTEKHLRGFYDGTDSVEVTRLITDIKLLKQEYEYNKNHH